MLHSRFQAFEKDVEQCIVRHEQIDEKFKALTKKLDQLFLQSSGPFRVQHILSFCMSQHPRLGMQSPATGLPSEITLMISVMAGI